MAHRPAHAVRAGIPPPATPPGPTMAGLHLLADLRRCTGPPELLTSADALAPCLEAAVVAAGLHPIARLFHPFPPTAAGPGGITGTVLLAESHVCVHTWPELAAVTLDVYVCNHTQDHSAGAMALLNTLIDVFRAEQVALRRVQRGLKE